MKPIDSDIAVLEQWTTHGEWEGIAWIGPDRAGGEVHFAKDIDGLRVRYLNRELQEAADTMKERAGGESSFPLQKGMDGDVLEKIVEFHASGALTTALLFVERQGVKLKEKGVVRVVVSVPVEKV